MLYTKSRHSYQHFHTKTLFHRKDGASCQNFPGTSVSMEAITLVLLLQFSRLFTLSDFISKSNSNFNKWRGHLWPIYPISPQNITSEVNSKNLIVWDKQQLLLLWNTFFCPIQRPKHHNTGKMKNLIKRQFLSIIAWLRDAINKNGEAQHRSSTQSNNYLYEYETWVSGYHEAGVYCIDHIVRQHISYLWTCPIPGMQERDTRGNTRFRGYHNACKSTFLTAIKLGQLRKPGKGWEKIRKASIAGE